MSLDIFPPMLIFNVCSGGWSSTVSPTVVTGLLRDLVGDITDVCISSGVSLGKDTLGHSGYNGSSTLPSPTELPATGMVIGFNFFPFLLPLVFLPDGLVFFLLVVSSTGSGMMVTVGSVLKAYTSCILLSGSST